MLKFQSALNFVKLGRLYGANYCQEEQCIPLHMVLCKKKFKVPSCWQLLEDLQKVIAHIIP